MFGHAVASFLDGHAPQPFCCCGGGIDHRRADAIHFGLGRVKKLSLRIMRGNGEVTGLLDGEQVFVHNQNWIGSLATSSTAS